MRATFLKRKADRYVFARFVCRQCGTRQSQPVPVGKKSCRCIDCQAPHKISVHETSLQP